MNNRRNDDQSQACQLEDVIEARLKENHAEQVIDEVEGNYANPHKSKKIAKSACGNPHGHGRGAPEAEANCQREEGTESQGESNDRLGWPVHVGTKDSQWAMGEEVIEE